MTISMSAIDTNPGNAMPTQICRSVNMSCSG
jgi:hypothetical protein